MSPGVSMAGPGDSGLAVRNPSSATYRPLASIFGADLVASYRPQGLYQDLAKTTLNNATDQENKKWENLANPGVNDLSGNPFLHPAPFPLPRTYKERLNGYLVWGSGWSYDITTGAQHSEAGDPGDSATYDASNFQDGVFDATVDTYNIITVSKNLMDDSRQSLLYDTVNFGDELRALFNGDHHTITGNCLQNYTFAGGFKGQFYMGPDALAITDPSYWHHDGVWRVIVATLSWTRTRNALWKSGKKYSPDGNPLVRQTTVDTGASADVLVPTFLNCLLSIQGFTPTAEYNIVKNVQSDSKILEACRYLGRYYQIFVE